MGMFSRSADILLGPYITDAAFKGVTISVSNGSVTVILGERRRAVPTARAYQLLHMSGLIGNPAAAMASKAAGPVARYQTMATATALLGDWQY